MLSYFVGRSCISVRELLTKHDNKHRAKSSQVGYLSWRVVSRTINASLVGAPRIWISSVSNLSLRLRTGRDRSRGGAYALLDLADFGQAPDMSSSQAVHRSKRGAAVDTGARATEGRHASVVARRDRVSSSFDGIRLGLQVSLQSLVLGRATNHLSFPRKEDRAVGTPSSCSAADESDAWLFTPEDDLMKQFHVDILSHTTPQAAQSIGLMFSLKRSRCRKTLLVVLDERSV